MFFLRHKGGIRTIEDSLSLLMEKAKEGPVTIGTISEILSGKVRTLLLMLLCLPFVEIVGLAIPAGLLLAYIGIRYALNKWVFLPNFILRKKISSKLLTKAVNMILRVLKKIEPLTRPRLSFHKRRSQRIFTGLLVALMGLVIALSPPVPASSILACLSIFFIGIGMFNDDGVFVIIGYFFSSCYFAYVIFILHLYLKI